MIQKEDRANAVEGQEPFSESEGDDDADDEDDGSGTLVVVTAEAAVMVKKTGMKRAPIAKPTPRRLISLDETVLVQRLTLYVKNHELVYSWAVTPHLNFCLVNFNLRRSCKVGLRRM
jgi:hypothetical protein